MLRNIAVAHVLKKCIEQVKLNDQCQGIAEIKMTKGYFERVRLCALRGGAEGSNSCHNMFMTK